MWKALGLIQAPLKRKFPTLIPTSTESVDGKENIFTLQWQKKVHISGFVNNLLLCYYESESQITEGTHSTKTQRFANHIIFLNCAVF
jgi:hypothetical protein